MSELKVASCFEFEKVLRGKSNKLFYPKSEVDAVIAELQAENKSALKAVSHWHDNYCELQKVVDRLQTKSECKEDKIRILKRALWLARADRAMMTLDYFTLKCRWFKDYMKVEPPGCDVKMISKWANIARKCRAKAEEYYK